MGDGSRTYFGARGVGRVLVGYCRLLKECQYCGIKVLLRWYGVLVVAAHLHPGSSPLCFRGCQEPGTIVHIWWSCPKGQNFWKKVYALLTKLFQCTIRPEAKTLLLNIKPETLKKKATQANATHPNSIQTNAGTGLAGWVNSLHGSPIKDAAYPDLWETGPDCWIRSHNFKKRGSPGWHTADPQVQTETLHPSE